MIKKIMEPKTIPNIVAESIDEVVVVTILLDVDVVVVIVDDNVLDVDVVVIEFVAMYDKIQL